jgi:hypothetical protein
MLHEYHVIYSVRYYLWFQVIAVDFGTFYPWIWVHCHTWIRYKMVCLRYLLILVVVVIVVVAAVVVVVVVVVGVVFSP